MRGASLQEAPKSPKKGQQCAKEGSNLVLSWDWIVVVSPVSGDMGAKKQYGATGGCPQSPCCVFIMEAPREGSGGTPPFAPRSPKELFCADLKDESRGTGGAMPPSPRARCG